jgi:hypothetical protein
MLAPATSPEFCQTPDGRLTGPAAYNQRGDLVVKPLEKLPGPTRELVAAGGKLSDLPFTVPPLSEAQLRSKRLSLLRELKLLTQGLDQTETELAQRFPATAATA